MKHDEAKVLRKVVKGKKDNFTPVVQNSSLYRL
jgi:hypothetical protein